MDKLYSAGMSVLTLYRNDGKGGYTISIVSRRAAEFVLRQSAQQKWALHYSQTVPPILLIPGKKEKTTIRIKLIGFCPENGFHLATMHQRR